MKRVLTLAALAAIALTTPEPIAARGLVAAGTAREGAVTSLSVLPTSGRAEVVIGLDGAVEVQDFVLRNPDKIVLDLTGASLGLPAQGYDRVSRGGIVDVRWSQYRRNVVRVVITLDGTRSYEVVRGERDLRVRVQSEGANSFTAWHAVAEPTERARSEEKPPSDQMEAIAKKASPALQQQRSQQPRITTAFINTPIRDVIASFAAFSGRTIVVGKNVEGTVDAEISDQPWDVAMKAILDAHGFAATEDQNGIIVVDTYQNISARMATEPLVTRTLRLNYAPARDVAANVANRLTRDCRSVGPSVLGNTTPSGTVVAPTQIGGQQPAAGGGGCATRGAVTADTLTNSVSVTDVPSNIALLEEYVRSLDLRQPQVAIKAKIIFVDRTQLEALGFKYDLGYDPRIGPGQFFNKLIQRKDSAGEPLDQNSNQVLLGGNVLAGLGNASSIIPNSALQLIYSTALGNFSFTSFLDALSDVQFLDVQAEPSVVTLNNRMANLTAGVEVPVRVIDLSAAGSGGANAPARATVQFKKTGVILQVTPQITANRQIMMKVHAENSSVQFANTDVGALFPTQSVDNEVLVADGETAVMGGLTQTTISISKSGIPILMDLPFIGRLFGVTNRNETKRDLLVLITPHIVDEGESVPPDARR